MNKRTIVGIFLILSGLFCLYLAYQIATWHPKVEYMEDNEATVGLVTKIADVGGTWQGTIAVVGSSDYVLTLILHQDENIVDGTYLENHGQVGEVTGDFINFPEGTLVLTGKDGVRSAWIVSVFPNLSGMSVVRYDNQAIGNLQRR